MLNLWSDELRVSKCDCERSTDWDVGAPHTQQHCGNFDTKQGRSFILWNGCHTWTSGVLKMVPYSNAEGIAPNSGLSSVLRRSVVCATESDWCSQRHDAHWQLWWGVSWRKRQCWKFDSSQNGTRSRITTKNGEEFSASFLTPNWHRFHISLEPMVAIRGIYMPLSILLQLIESWLILVTQFCLFSEWFAAFCAMWVSPCCGQWFVDF